MLMYCNFVNFYFNNNYGPHFRYRAVILYESVHKIRHFAFGGGSERASMNGLRKWTVLRAQAGWYLDMKVDGP